MKLTCSANTPSSARFPFKRTMKGSRLASAALATLFLATSTSAWTQQAPKPAEDATKKANAALLKELPFSDKTSFELAHKGFVAPLPEGMIKGAQGNLVWDPTKYNFI